MRIGRKYMEGSEFLERQQAFEFGRAARVVMPIIVKLKKAMRAWEKPARLIAQAMENLMLPLYCDISVAVTKKEAKA